MASNSYVYQDPSEGEQLTNKQLNGLAFRSMLLQASFNYERMQAGGWLYSILPGLRKAHKNKQDLSKSMKDHLEFFNTHPFDVTFIMGVILAMERTKEDREAIRGIKVATMGPLGGIGDALFYLTALPIAAGIGSSLAIDGNIFGPIVFLLLFNAIHFGSRFGLMHYGYRTGVKAIAKLKEGTQKVSRAASIVGLSVVGGLIATYVEFSIDYTWTQGEAELDIQNEVLDEIMPALIPLGYTLLMYWLLKKGFSPIWLIIITVVVGIIGSGLGIMSAGE
ncbi:PTS system mannose/fructose/sorbose family transporter subunit IID [Virgibacillus sp. NKC19-3]|uniref:PTS system mannose/fructose/sorbose family transporter subunit IID n=1 Tax=Virgibacillus saliphilus TaxID=2831674 RepID=UPI001C9A353C|nr:PTS system mannose/fructose/sorbose family transporter subunit IID [Virgibacillus sp. NKC19-3]MBY7142860.1 PTS system mannose/fructose/sorbose family transporter subunit IID [Virgibacillus sp. NKC19-3]